MLRGENPFIPDRPVPVDRFVGREDLIERIRVRGLEQVAKGIPKAFFIEGEYGIGKTSLAEYISWIAEKDYDLLVLRASLGNVKQIEEIGEAVLEATKQIAFLKPRLWDKIMGFLAKYVDLKISGVSIDLDALKREGPTITKNLFYFLMDFYEKFKGYEQSKGILLILDEINGISSNPDFARYLKTFWETNPVNATPLPLMLILCGTEERRRELFKGHEPIARIFYIVTTEPLSNVQVKDFFTRSFKQIDDKIETEPIIYEKFIHYSGGLPKIMHSLGNEVFYIAKNSTITKSDASKALTNVTQEIGQKYIDQQILKDLRNPYYESILKKIAFYCLREQSIFNPKGFTRRELERYLNLTGFETEILDDLLTRLVSLKVIREIDVGKYEILIRMVFLYIFSMIMPDDDFDIPSIL